MINYLKNENIIEIFNKEKKYFRKKSVTLGSLLIDDYSKVEDNKLITYVKDLEGNIKEETRNELKEGLVIARNPMPLKEGVFNEWLVPLKTWIESYGESPTKEFKKYKKKEIITGIIITPEILNILNSTDDLTAKIEVSWSDEGMFVYKDGILTNKGYGIAPEELKLTYEVLS
jgi:hypothetical protein